MPARERGIVTSGQEELDRLIEDYADGLLDAAELRRLVDLLDSSAEARDRLAHAAVVERLLHALRRGPVPSRQIMEAVAAQAAEQPEDVAGAPDGPPTQRRIEVSKERGATRIGPRRRQTPTRAESGVERSPLWAVAVLGAMGLILGVMLWFKPRSPPHSGAPQATRAPQAGAGPGLAQPAHPGVAEQPAPPAETPFVVAVSPPPQGILPAVYRAFPLEPPPPPPGEDLSPPKGDGADEPGFAAPPAAWLAEAARHRAGQPTPAAPGSGAAATEPQNAALPPLLWVKIRPCPRQPLDATPDDLPCLLNVIRQQLAISAGMAERTIDEIDPDPGANPILYLTGYHHFEFTRAQRIALRKFMLAGGMLIFDAGLGSKPFYESARRELRLVFPDIPIERLTSDHPIYHAYHDLDRISYGSGVRQAGYTEDTPWFDGITISCRAAAVISRWGMAAGWEGRQTDSFRAYCPEDARRLGINLFCYAAATRAWARRASYAATFTDADPSRSGKMFVAQIIYNGEWQTRYAALSMLLRTFNQRTDVPVNLIVKPMRLTDPDVFNVPLLYMTGHLGVTLGEEELAKLAQYLRNGGFLFAEACCGRSSFDRSFRALMSRVLPGQPLTPISGDAVLYRVPNRIEFLGVTPSLGARQKSMLMRPRLEGIKLGASYGVIYSPYGLAGGWEMSQMPYADGYEDADALRLGQNILTYAITQ